MFATPTLGLLLALTSFFTTITAAPATRSISARQQCNALVENDPWQLSNIQLFKADGSDPTKTSSIKFHFCDQNSRLELETECSYIFPAGTESTPGYEPCADADIRFTYSGGLLQVERHYEDPCLGPPPLYDQGTFFGHNNTDFTVTKVSGGELSTQTALKVPITSQS